MSAPLTVERVLQMNREIATRLPALTCPRCGYKAVARVCDFCGRDRTATLTTTETDDE